MVDATATMRIPLERTLLRRDLGMTNLFLGFNHRYRILRNHQATPERAYRVETTYSEYAIYDHNQRGLLVYHWHPHGTSKTTIPHFHVGSAILDTTGHEIGKIFSRLHLPSGHVTIADVVRALIEEFDVLPIHARWDETLRACQEAFERQRTEF